MSKKKIVSGFLIALFPFLAGCKSIHESVLEWTANTEADELEVQLSDLERQNIDLTEENSTLASRLNRSEQKNAELEKAMRAPAPPPPPQAYENSGVTIDDTPTKTIVRIPANLTFRPGKYTVTPAGRKVLDKIIAMIRKTHPKGRIRVEGHADSDPIRKSKNHCNFELAYRRAHSVMHYLAESGGISSKRMSISSFGPHQPHDPARKSKNRRVELIILKD